MTAQRERPILHLNLHSNWFHMIVDGIKKEEYRAITPYWFRVFNNGKIKIKGKYYHPTEVTIRFSNGYKKDRPQFDIECLGMSVGFGLVEWGASPVEQYFVLKLGERQEQ